MNKAYNQNSFILFTHFIIHKSQIISIKTDIINKNLRFQVSATISEVIQILTVHQQIVNWPGKLIIVLCSLRALSSTEPGQLAQGQPRASLEPV